MAPITIVKLVSVEHDDEASTHRWACQVGMSSGVMVHEATHVSHASLCRAAVYGCMVLEFLMSVNFCTCA